MSARAEDLKDRLPQLRQVVTFEQNSDIFDVEFYPFAQPDGDPVFAVTGGKNTFVYKLNGGSGGRLERIRWFVDEEGDETELCTLCWIPNYNTGEPLLCVAGNDRCIKILNVATGELIKTIHGHGAQINDIQRSPADPLIIASGSEDNAIRVWHLHPEFAHQPCSAVLHGEGGHETGLLKLAFHTTNSRYLLSGGFDTKICLWVLPEYPTAPNAPYGSAGGDHANIIHFPHFCTTALHFHHTDAVAWHGDLILSKSCGGGTERKGPEHNRILLWRISGFNSRKPVPPATAAPANMPRGIHTSVSAWSDTTAGSGGFQVLMSFEIPGTEANWMRFGLSPRLPLPPAKDAEAMDVDGDNATLPPQSGPILVMGGHTYYRPRPPSKKTKAAGGTTWLTQSRVHMWDLGLLAEGILGQGAVQTITPKGIAMRTEKGGSGSSTKNRLLNPLTSIPSRLSVSTTARESSILSSEVSHAQTSYSSAMVSSTSGGGGGDVAGNETINEKATNWGPYTQQKAHKIVELGTAMKIPKFTPRTVAWSMDGKICVVVGNDVGQMWIMGMD